MRSVARSGVPMVPANLVINVCLALLGLRLLVHGCRSPLPSVLHLNLMLLWQFRPLHHFFIRGFVRCAIAFGRYPGARRRLSQMHCPSLSPTALHISVRTLPSFALLRHRTVGVLGTSFRCPRRYCPRCTWLYVGQLATMQGTWLPLLRQYCSGFS